MKYFIITLVIGAILTLLAFFFDFTNNKNDKYFLIFISTILVLSGLIYSIKYEISKDKDETEKITKINTTLTNTEKIKSKADSIITNLNKSLDKTLILSDSINSQNLTLDLLESDIKKQIKTLNKTLKQTEIFEKKVNEQLKLEKEKFELDKPDIVLSVHFAKYNNPNFYRILQKVHNTGKRNADSLQTSVIMIFAIDKVITHHQILDNSPNNNIKIYPSNISSKNLYSQERFELNDIDKKYNGVMMKIRITYFDSATNSEIRDVKYFAWLGKKESNLQFHEPNTEWSETIDDYIKGNNIKF